MIPKVIHYCWFSGNPLTPLAEKCIASWKKHCPDYEIQQWNTSNFDINHNLFMKQAFDAKKWAFVSDVVRLYVLYTYGGIYLDSDVEMVKPIEPFLRHKAFTCFEKPGYIEAGVMASEKSVEIFKEFLGIYEGKPFFNEDGTYDMISIVTKTYPILCKYGITNKNKRQIINNLVIYPKEYFSPKDHYTGKIKTTTNTYCIHHYSASWLTRRRKMWRWILHHIPIIRFLNDVRKGKA